MGTIGLLIFGSLGASVVCMIVGGILLHTKKRQRITAGAVLFIAGVLFMVTFLVGAVIASSRGKSGTAPGQTEQVSTGEDSEATYSNEFVSACGEVGIDTALIEGWERVDDWANGARYRFTYKRHPFYAYMNYDGSVHSIMVGNTVGTAVYLQGYVPYNVEDYLVDEDTAMALIPYAEDAVKLALNYPATADFPLLDWTYGREKDLYQLQSTVTAQNGFGVEEEMPFTVIFDLGTEGKAKCVYLELNGSVISNEMPEEPEREAVAVPEKSADTPAGTIRLVDGELGEYGRQDPVYPEYIDYYLPAGHYTATGNGKNNIVMVIDNATNDEVSRVTLAAGESGELEVSANQHIELAIYSDATLTEVQ